ncbi:hypothetical protein RHIZ_23345 [Rhizobium skierniewicense]|nr:hypothetical protein [Rhizobium skierniewicense]
MLEEYTTDYLDSTVAVPFMLTVFPVIETARRVIPAVVQGDNTARLHTVRKRVIPSITV